MSQRKPFQLLDALQARALTGAPIPAAAIYTHAALLAKNDIISDFRQQMIEFKNRLISAAENGNLHAANSLINLANSENVPDRLFRNLEGTCYDIYIKTFCLDQKQQTYQHRK